jgi:hypothetical protein
MKKLFFASFAIVLFLSIGSESSNAQSSAKGPIAGEYSSIQTDTKEARETALFAVATESRREERKLTLVRILNAKKQVATGVNYRICMRVRDEKGKRKTVTAVVFRSTEAELSLTGWEDGKCEDPQKDDQGS